MFIAENRTQKKRFRIESIKKLIIASFKAS